MACRPVVSSAGVVVTDPTALIVRPAGLEDMGFVYSTWVNSHVYSQPDRDRARVRKFFRYSYVLPLLGTLPRILVLASPDRPNTLHGHVVARGGVLCWAYVAFPLRRAGYGRQLITAVLGEYPDTIPVHTMWPFESTRFQFKKWERVA